jgi:hypothetical protein
MMPLAMTARVLSLALGCLLATPVGAGAQAFFTATPSPDLRIAPLTIRAAVTPAEGPVPMRVQFGVMAPAGATVPDLYLLWPGEVKGDPSLGAPQPDLAEQVTALRYEVIDEGRLVLRARNLTAGGGPGAREPVPGGAPYVTFVQTGGAVGLSAPGTWIRIPSTPRLADPGWITTLEISSLSAVKAKRPTWLERLVLGERRLFAMSFHEVRGRPLFRMYLAHRDRLVRLGDAPAEMVVSFSESDHLKIDSVAPPTAVRGVSETAESTETITLYLEAGEGLTPQRLSVQYGYFSSTQAIAVVAIPLVLLLLGYAIGPLVGRVTLHLAQRLAGRFHLSRWDGMPRERKTGVVLSRDVLERIRPGETTQDEVLRLCGPNVEVLEHIPSDGHRTLVYRGRHVRPQTRRLIGLLAAVRHLEVEQHEVSIELADGVVRDVKADIRRSRVAVGDGDGAPPA